MSRNYDNWERLVRAVVRREEYWQMAHDHSRSPSINSLASDFSARFSSSSLSDYVPVDIWRTEGSSLYQQNQQDTVYFNDRDHSRNTITSSSSLEFDVLSLSFQREERNVENGGRNSRSGSNKTPVMDSTMINGTLDVPELLWDFAESNKNKSAAGLSNDGPSKVRGVQDYKSNGSCNDGGNGQDKYFLIFLCSFLIVLFVRFLLPFSLKYWLHANV